MVNLKKYNAGITQIVLILTLFAALSCSRKSFHVTRIEGTEIAVTDSLNPSASLEEFIAPYRENIDKDMNTVLTYAPQTLDKQNGKWQTAIGNLMADAAIARSNPVFRERTGKEIDMALLNFGGIRSIIPKGNVTIRTAFEIMPFENRLVVAELRGEQIFEIANYIVAEKKAHPISGISFTIQKNSPVDVAIQGKPVEKSLIYHVVTSDYLINGGDRMTFFKKAIATHELDYKLRNVLIDHFREIDTIRLLNDRRIHATE